MSKHGFYRVKGDKAIAGGCSCIARGVKADVVLVRCVTVAMIPFGLFVCIAYGLIWLITEER